MRPTTLLLTIMFATASVVVAQTPSAAPKAPTTSSPATTTTTTASSPATTTTTASSPATTTATTTSAMPSEAEMMAKMMELSKLNDNHKLLATTAGTWSYTVKSWMDPKATKPMESKGTATRKAIMDGRYVSGDYSGKFKMPGADGKMVDMNFQGMSMDGYDNVKKKFVSGWVDNMGTGIMMTEGTYDPATKAFTYTGSFEEIPGMTTKVRQVIKITDKDHMTMEFYNDRGQGETKGMEINYTRQK